MDKDKFSNLKERDPFFSSVVPPASLSEPAFWFAFQGDKLLVAQEESSVRIPHMMDFRETGLKSLREHYLGRLDSQHCYTVEVENGASPPPNMKFEGLRQVYGHLDEDLFWIAGRAIQILDWDRTHQFCGRCGTLTIPRPRERAKECPKCGLMNFPRLSPAIIVLIQRDHELLLARRRFGTGFYSVLAGFVEPGETLEEAVVREVKEEVGLTVKDIRYFGSQPWPFPNSLMLGFTATYASGEISPDDDEIEAAGWFSADRLPPIPGRISIARKLIDWFLEKQGKGLRE